MKILSNSAITLDGRLAESASEFVPPGSEADHRFMSELRNRVDAVLVGGNSFRCTPLPLLPNPEHLAGPLRPLPYWNIVVSRGLQLPIQGAYYEESRIQRLFFVSEAGAAGAASFPAEVVHPPTGDPTPAWMVAQLEQRGVQSLLIEAGGDLIYQFLAADLIDELYVTLCPAILGKRGAPAIADGLVPLGAPFKRLSLAEVRVVGHEVFLKYLRG